MLASELSVLVGSLPVLVELELMLCFDKNPRTPLLRESTVWEEKDLLVKSAIKP